MKKGGLKVPIIRLWKSKSPGSEGYTHKKPECADGEMKSLPQASESFEGHWGKGEHRGSGLQCFAA